MLRFCRESWPPSYRRSQPALCDERRMNQLIRRRNLSANRYVRHDALTSDGYPKPCSRPLRSFHEVDGTSPTAELSISPLGDANGQSRPATSVRGVEPFPLPATYLELFGRAHAALKGPLSRPPAALDRCSSRSDPLRPVRTYGPGGDAMESPSYASLS